MKNKVKRVRRKDVSGVEAHFSEKIKATSASISVVCRYNPIFRRKTQRVAGSIWKCLNRR